MSIQVENVSHIYHAGGPLETVALRDVSLQINDGDFLALIGHTGSGKSTLAQHLNGLIKPTTGRVLVDGMDTSDLKADRREIRRRVGLVFQYPEHQLFEETIKRDIGFGPRNLGLSDEEIDTRVREACARVHIDYQELAEKSPFELSGGQMRRVAIAGVLAMRPKTLVMDEPTAGLDPHGRDELLSLITEFNRDGATVVLISHSMEDVARVASRVAVMADGTVRHVGLPRDVFANADMLRALSLDIPVAARLRLALETRGIHLSENEYRMDALRDAIIACWKKEVTPC